MSSANSLLISTHIIHRRWVDGTSRYWDADVELWIPSRHNATQYPIDVAEEIAERKAENTTDPINAVPYVVRPGDPQQAEYDTA